MMKRRALLASGAAAVFLGPAPRVAAQTFTFKEAAAAMRSIAVGLAAYVDALKKSNAAKAPSVSTAQAEDAAELLALYSQVTELVMVQRSVTLAEMEKYGDGPMPSQWPEIQARIGRTVESIDKVNDLFDRQINGFILSDLYPMFKSNFGSRGMVLSSIQQLPAPKTKKDVRYFRELVDQYRALLNQVDALRAELQLMLRVTGGTGGMAGAAIPNTPTGQPAQ